MGVLLLSKLAMKFWNCCYFVDENIQEWNLDIAVVLLDKTRWTNEKKNWHFQAFKSNFYRTSFKCWFKFHGMPCWLWIESVPCKPLAEVVRWGLDLSLCHHQPILTLDSQLSENWVSLQLYIDHKSRRLVWEPESTFGLVKLWVEANWVRPSKQHPNFDDWQPHCPVNSIN